nr:recombinase family protein [Streptomyces sp. NBC_00857]
MNKQNTEIATAVSGQAVSGQYRAVVYARVSTEEQAKGYGVTYSTKKILRHIERKGWAHVGTYADEGFSGSLEAADRDDLKRLMEDAHKKPKPFDVVVVNEGRVIGRTGRAFWRWVWVLEDIGIYVAVVEDDYDNTTVEGRKKMRRDADYAETEWETIRKRTQGGLQEKAEEGGWVGGPPPFGYAIKDQGKKGESHLILCADECKVLNRAHELLVVERLNMRDTDDAAEVVEEGVIRGLRVDRRFDVVPVGEPEAVLCHMRVLGEEEPAGLVRPRPQAEVTLLARLGGTIGVGLRGGGSGVHRQAADGGHGDDSETDDAVMHEGSVRRGHHRQQPDGYQVLSIDYT